jgi:hypothetical protein
MNNWFHHYFGIIHLINVEVYWQYFFVCAETSSPMPSPKRGKATIWVFRPIQQLGREKDQDLFRDRLGHIWNRPRSQDM